MKLSVLYIILLAFYSVQCRGVNGGLNCAVCTVVMGIATQVAEIHKESLVNGIIRLCSYLPVWAKDECNVFAAELSPYVSDMDYLSPDLICLVYGSCRIDEGENLCHLFPIISSKKSIIRTLRKLKLRKNEADRIEFCDLPLIQDVCDILNNSYTNLEPIQDADVDGHSLLNSGRGSDWKGKDCNDFDPNVYPGRTPVNGDRYTDSNCNGIYGVNESDSKEWENTLCKGSAQRGVIYIGDSVGAHFHMPQIWMNPINFEPPMCDGIDAILDELDWPQLGFATGFMNSTTPILIKGATDSVYLRLRARNRCNHRDYQNVARNGASSYDGPFLVNSIDRNRTHDNPAIVFYAMIGNDVCNSLKPEDTVSNMTTPEDFKMNVMKTLEILNEKLPSDSHVVLVGLVNADFIYPAMAQLLHPLGLLRRNLRYKDMYNWFNCMQIGPCTGWLNSNSTLRDLTSKRATELTQVLQDTARVEKFQRFSLHFIDNPINAVINRNKINIPKLLESVDSLHPNQLAQPLLAQEVWKNLRDVLPPEVLGPVNPNNEIIKAIFGDQGGH